MSVSKCDLWKSRYLNELNAHCGMSGYSYIGRPLIKNQWTKIKWELCDLDETGQKYCCYMMGKNDEKEWELCMNCAGWLDKYHRELNTREAEERGMDTLVPLLEKIIENQEILLGRINEMCDSLNTISKNTAHTEK